MTAECLAIYRQQYWRSDQTTRIADHLQNGSAAGEPITVLHFHPGDIPVAGWRNDIYEREHLADRLSFIYAPLPGQAYAINLYREESQGPFRSAEVEQLRAVAPLLRQVHQGALRLGGAQNKAIIRPQSLMEYAGGAIESVAPKLSPRELQVCARIACGISADGIAAELDIAPSTVMTLRKRAYAKLADAGLRGGRMALARLVRQG